MDDYPKSNADLWRLMRAAPWSNQRVGIFIRILAWIYVLAAVFVVASVIYFTLKDGLPENLTLGAIGFALLYLYMMMLFARVAISGKAPSGWLPWK